MRLLVMVETRCIRQRSAARKNGNGIVTLERRRHDAEYALAARDRNHLALELRYHIAVLVVWRLLQSPQLFLLLRLLLWQNVDNVLHGA